MVIKTNSHNRLAFTMIELIFAIVIIAIAVISLPIMTQVTSEGMKKNLAQEGIFTAIAEIIMATTYTWDENSLLDTVSTSNDLSRVIPTGTTGDCTNTTQTDYSGVTIVRRTGHVHRRCLNSLTATPYNILATDCNDSINHSEHNYNTTYEGSATTTSATGYKTAYQSKLHVERCDSGNCVDFNDTNNINMKEITVTIRDSEDNSIVTKLRAYSANIGEVAYHRRLIP